MADNVNAIILAGTPKKKKKLINEYDGKGPKNKAFVSQITGKPLVCGVLDCLRSSKYVNQDNITIIGPRPDLMKIIHDKKVLILPEKIRLIDNARTAYDELSIHGEKTIFITSDLPCLNSNTPEAIDDVIEKCLQYEADFYFSIINAKNIPQSIENLKKVAKFHLKGKGDYRTANLCLFEGKRIKNRDILESQIEKTFEKRRTSNRIARYALYGAIAAPYWKEIIKHTFKQLTERDAEKAVKREAGIDFKLIETTDQRLVIDVDSQRDYKFLKGNLDYL